MTALNFAKIPGVAALASLVLAVPTMAQETAAEVAPAVEAAIEAVPAIDTGDTAWMFVSTIIVILMTIPGLALFYGGLVRSKNILSVLSQIFAGFCMIALLWVAYGYSLAFGGSEGGLGAYIGDLGNLFLGNVTPESISGTLPELVFVAFQLTFAAITSTLIVGGIAERMKFGAVMLFLAIWFTFSYLPIAHMVWSGPALFFTTGALVFAVGTVVHLNSAVSARNLTFAFIGACLLWVGWFGFNAGSALAANGTAAQAFLNTITAPAAAALAWGLGEKFSRGHASLLGVASGAVAGLVAITPAAGFVGTVGGIVLGAVAGFVCLWAVVTLKPLLKYDDSLDVFGIHGIGGIVGALGTGILAAPSLGGFGSADYDMGGQMVTQTLAVGVAIVWTAVVTFVALLIVKAVFGGIRVAESAESDGLDISSHGERAYN